MKEQCAVLSTEEQKKGMREESSGAGKWEPCNSHDSQWEDCLETRGGDRWTQGVHSLLVLEIFCFLLQFDLSSEYVNSPAVEPASRA